MAVSKVISGSGSSAKRFLFSVSAGDIVRSEITGSGISAGIPVATSAELRLDIEDFDAIEAELSWGANYLAWSSDNGMVHVIGLTMQGDYISGSLQSYSIPEAKGIEFTMYASNPKLYVSGQNGLTQILTSNQSQTIVSKGTFDLTNSKENYQIDVLDMTGRQVLLLLPDTKIEQGIFEKSFDISTLKRGIYSYRIKSTTCMRIGLVSKF